MVVDLVKLEQLYWHPVKVLDGEWQAPLYERAVVAPFIGNRWRKGRSLQNCADGQDCGLGQCPQARPDLNLAPPSRAMMKDCSSRNPHAQHLFEAKGLGG